MSDWELFQLNITNLAVIYLLWGDLLGWQS